MIPWLDFKAKWVLRTASRWPICRSKARLWSTTPPRITYGLKNSSMIFHPELHFRSNFPICQPQCQKVMKKSFAGQAISQLKLEWQRIWEYCPLGILSFRNSTVRIFYYLLYFWENLTDLSLCSIGHIRQDRTTMRHRSDIFCSFGKIQSVLHLRKLGK